MNFTLAVAPPFVHPMTSLPATPTHSVRKYGFLSEPTRQRQVAKYGTFQIGSGTNYCLTPTTYAITFKAA